MRLFLLLALPLTYLYVCSFLKGNRINLIRAVLPFAGGMGLTLPSLIFYGFTLPSRDFIYSWGGAFRFFFSDTSGWIILILPIICLLLYGKEKPFAGGGRFEEICGWTTGYFFLLSLRDSVAGGIGIDTLQVNFTIPLLRSSQALSLAFFIAFFRCNKNLIPRGYSITGIVLTFFLFPQIAVLGLYLNLPGLSLIFALLLYGGLLFFVFKLHEKRVFL